VEESIAGLSRAGIGLVLIALFDLPTLLISQRANPVTIVDGWYGFVVHSVDRQSDAGLLL
jgi:hypothetical protein